MQNKRYAPPFNFPWEEELTESARSLVPPIEDTNTTWWEQD